MSPRELFDPLPDRRPVAFSRRGLVALLALLAGVVALLVLAVVLW